MCHYLSILSADLSDRRRGSYISVEKPRDYLFGGVAIVDRTGGDFDSRYSQKGVQWAVKEAAKRAGIIKEVHVHTLRHTCATHLLEDGMDIISVKNFLGHENIETTIRTADAAIPACSSVADQTCFQSA
jgi:integrase